MALGINDQDKTMETKLKRVEQTRETLMAQKKAVFGVLAMCNTQGDFYRVMIKIMSRLEKGIRNTERFIITHRLAVK